MINDIGFVGPSVINQVLADTGDIALPAHLHHYAWIYSTFVYSMITATTLSLSVL
jgi:hypothetical protein